MKRLGDMTDAEKMAQAVLLFYQAAFWTDEEKFRWFLLTGSYEGTTKVLADYARTFYQEPLL